MLYVYISISQVHFHCKQMEQVVYDQVSYYQVIWTDLVDVSVVTLAKSQSQPGQQDDNTLRRTNAQCLSGLNLALTLSRIQFHYSLHSSAQQIYPDLKTIACLKQFPMKNLHNRAQSFKILIKFKEENLKLWKDFAKLPSLRWY